MVDDGNHIEVNHSREHLSQLQFLKEGSNFISISEACIVGNGISEVNEEDKEKFIKVYENFEGNILKFVPASGAASRMFVALRTFLETGIEDEKIKSFFSKIEQLPFYHSAFSSLDKKEICRYVLYSNDFGFDSKPKGLIPFHRYDDSSVAPFEEHITEAKNYLGKNGKMELHFTVSEEHLKMFQQKWEDVLKAEPTLNETIKLSFSFQKKETDTVSLDDNKQVLCDENGKPVLRPGGHGALLENLSDVNADLIFLKNIDNVTVKSKLQDTIQYKKILGGMALTIKQIFDKAAEAIEKEELSDEQRKELIRLLKKYHFDISESTSDKGLFYFLNRPLRVCGMVKNEGEPGGGPFFVKYRNTHRAQIVEKAQINLKDERQKQIFLKSTHFNPVDLACIINDYKGRKFDLKSFVDKDTAIVSEKIYKDKPIKIYEHPGLWNGSMALWNTVFIEVPLSTFNPVKEVNDLLRPGHQNN